MSNVSLFWDRERDVVSLLRTGTLSLFYVAAMSNMLTRDWHAQILQAMPMFRYLNTPEKVECRRQPKPASSV